MDKFMKNRTAKIIRNTKETQIELELNLDGSGKYDIETGIPFFNHMLELFTRHGVFDITIRAKGDIEIDYHHTVEDVGIVLGQAFKQAVGDKAGMNRYGFFILPMDETLVRIAVDLSNRPILVYDLGNSDGRVRDFNVSLCKEFFQAFARTAECTLHIRQLSGSNSHHIIEGAFKSVARSLKTAVAIDKNAKDQIPSTKGVL